MWRRDYALIFLSGALGMRVGEVCLFERRHFDIEHDVIHAPTLKQSEKITFICPKNMADGSACGRKSRVRLSAAGKEHKCYRCGQTSKVQELRPGQVDKGVAEVDIDIIEPKTAAFIINCLDEWMRPDQRWLFEGRDNYHLSKGHARRIFNTHAVAAGLDPNISFHSLRHHRGVTVYSLFKDTILCRDALRHKDVATTQIYAALDQEQKQTYREKLNEKAFDPLKKLRKNK